MLMMQSAKKNPVVDKMESNKDHYMKETNTFTNKIHILETPVSKETKNITEKV